MSFIHLRAASEYSIKQGLSKIDELVSKAAEDNQPALALTDKNGMFGAIMFYKSCQKKGVKPIFGVDMTVEKETPELVGDTQVIKKSNYQILALAKNDTGYKSLLDLHSRGYLENRTKDTVAIKEDWLANLKECVVLSGGIDGLIGQHLINDRYEEAKVVAQQMQALWGDDFYIELQRDASKNEQKYMSGAVKLCVELGIAPVATHANYFIDSDGYLANEARFCGANGYGLYQKDRPVLFNKDMYFKNTKEMQDLFADLPIALENTEIVAKKCSVNLQLNKPQLPHFPTPEGMTTDDYFAHLSKEGLEERLLQDYPNEEERNSKRKEYEDRLDYEIKVIQKMGFPGYFLIVGDFIKWAKDNEIPVGPGRGSGAGSLVAYSLKITNIDPLPFNLLFERFLNPDRVSMPDFDIDFCMSRRQEVIEYVRHKYGENAVSQISAYQTLGAKSSIKDAARLLGFYADFADNISKAINKKPTDEFTVSDLVFGNDKEDPLPEFKERYENEADFRKVMDIATKIEGLIRQVGRHAAGVVIAPTTMSDFTPIFTTDQGDSPASQFDKNDVEAAGLVKFDFLGLKLLTGLKMAVDMVNKTNEANGVAPINIDKIDMNDKEVFKNIFQNGNTGLIFQFEGTGMTSVIKDAQPNGIEDLIAINALYRPGPMDIIPEWLESKRTPEHLREYPHPLLKDTLKETYGFMIYQEQVMQCAQIIAGYSLGGADLLRRAMGKKDVDEMNRQRDIFITGAEKNNVDNQTATKLFDLIQKFSGYGFNKSHAAAYSVLAYQSAYLKHHYPQEFFMGILNSELLDNNTEKLAMAVNDAKSNGVKVSGVDINESDYLFKVNNFGELRYGMGAIKGIGAGPAQAIVKEREENGPYKDFYDFVVRGVSVNALNTRVMEALVRAGAFDSVHDRRDELFSNVAAAISYGKELNKNNKSEKSVLADALQLDLSNNVEVMPKKVRKNRKVKVKELPVPVLQEFTPWSDLELLSNEKKAYDYYFSNNPFKQIYEKELNGLKVKTPLNELENEYSMGKKQVFIAGLFSEFKQWKSKTGGFLTLTDGITNVSLMMNNEKMNKIKPWLTKDGYISFLAELQTSSQDDKMNIRVLNTFSFEETKEMLLQKAFVMVAPERIDETLNKMKPFLNDKNAMDTIPLIICTKKPGEKAVKVHKIPIKKSIDFLNYCKEEFGTEDFKVEYSADMSSIPKPLPKYNNNKGYKPR